MKKINGTFFLKFGILVFFIAVFILIAIPKKNNMQNKNNSNSETSFTNSNDKKSENLQILKIYFENSDIHTVCKKPLDEFAKENNFSVEYIIPPEISNTDSVNKRNAFIDAMKTEIMAGGGPDIFVIKNDETSGLFTSEEVALGILKSETIYPNLQKAINSNKFFDITEFIENSTIINNSSYAMQLLDAGTVNEKKYIVPLTFFIDGLSVVELPENTFDLKVENLPNNSFKLVEKLSENKKINLTSLYGRAYYFLKSPIIDENGDVSYDNEDWKNALLFFDKMQKDSVETDDVALTENTFLAALENESEKDDFEAKTFVPFCNINGKYDAPIQYCSAISQNCSNTSLAFSVMEFLATNKNVHLNITNHRWLGLSAQKDIVTNAINENNFLNDVTKHNVIYTINNLNTAYNLSNGSYQWFYSVEPFFKGQKTLDESIADAKNKLERLASE